MCIRDSIDVAAQQPELTYGNSNVIDLLPNTANQRVDISATNLVGQNIDSFDLFMQIGDGGAPLGGTDTGPGLTGVDLGDPGTVFEGGQRGTFNAASQTPLLWADLIENQLATFDGVVGTLIFDTTGFGPGTILPIRFEGISVGGEELNTFFSTNGADIRQVTSASNGTIRIIAAVPEPAGAIIILAFVGVAGLRRRR